MGSNPPTFSNIERLTRSAAPDKIVTSQSVLGHPRAIFFERGRRGLLRLKNGMPEDKIIRGLNATASGNKSAAANKASIVLGLSAASGLRKSKSSVFKI